MTRHIHAIVQVTPSCINCNTQHYKYNKAEKNQLRVNSKAFLLKRKLLSREVNFPQQPTLALWKRLEKLIKVTTRYKRTKVFLHYKNTQTSFMLLLRNYFNNT